MAEVEWVDYELSDGRKARSRRPTGMDMVRAGRVVAKADVANPQAQQIAVTAMATQIDGHPALYEDVLTWPAEDLYTMIAKATGVGKSSSSTDDTSSPSPRPPIPGSTS